MFDVLPQLTSMAGINPFDWVDGPSLGPFDSILKSKIGMFLALAWAIGFCFCAFYFVSGLTQMSRGRKSHTADHVEEGKQTAMWAGGIAIALVAVPTVFGVLVQ